MSFNKAAFIFPGQGSQYVGMGRDFYDQYQEAREVFQEADERLKRPLSRIIFEGPESELTHTRNSQTGIYVVSNAILRVLAKELPEIRPSVCGGLSLGEYTAVTASGRLSFADGLDLVQARGQFMNDACESHKGTMAVVMGLSAEEVEEMVLQLGLPDDLWAANFNCPGQVVISGTPMGVEKGVEEAKKRGARRAMPLQVHGAFHSGLMAEARERLRPLVEGVELQPSQIGLVMNVPGDFVQDPLAIRENLVCQVTAPVRWEQSVKAMDAQGVDAYVEIGCGKSLTGMLRRMQVQGTGMAIEKVSDLEVLASKI